MNCVIGHPRSGTAFLAALLNAGGTQYCRHEYLAALSSMCVPVPTDYYAGRATDEDVHRLLRHYDFTPTPWVLIDSNWKLTWILPPFLERFPDARVLHLSRDPRTNVPACHNLDIYGDLHHRPEFAYRRFWLEWMPAVRRPDWGELSQFERNCAFWTETHRVASEALAGHQHAWQVPVEALGRGRIRRELFDFFGLPRPTRRQSAKAARTGVNEKTKLKATLKACRDETLSAFADWPEGRQRRLVELCGETAAALGYDL